MDQKVETGPVQIVDSTALAFGIQFNVSFPNGRALVFTTACAQDIDDAELSTLLKRMSKQGDILDAQYKAGVLQKELERFERDLSTARQQQANHATKAQEDWELSNRRGPFAMSKSQQGTYNNFENTINQCKEMIKRIRADIEEAKKAAAGE